MSGNLSAFELNIDSNIGYFSVQGNVYVYLFSTLCTLRKRTDKTKDKRIAFCFTDFMLNLLMSLSVSKVNIRVTRYQVHIVACEVISARKC